MPKYYPYRQLCGHRGVLDALSIDDARYWLLDNGGVGTAFCEVDMTEEECNRINSSSHKDTTVDRWLEKKPCFVT